jgi:hypothetical protein
MEPFPTKLGSKKIQAYRLLYYQGSKMVRQNNHILWWRRKDKDDTSHLIIVVGILTERGGKLCLKHLINSTTSLEHSMGTSPTVAILSIRPEPADIYYSLL